LKGESLSLTDDKLILLKSHDCSRGLSEEVLHEIANAAELVKVNSGDYLHRADQPIESVHLIVHGRFQQEVVDISGKVIIQRFLSRGSQFGALAAAQADPIPVNVFALEPSATLKFDFETTLGFTRKHESFGRNLVQSISNMVTQALCSNRHQKKAMLVTVFHESVSSRSLTPRLIRRLQELGESPNVMGDRNEWEPIDGVGFRPLVENGQLLTREAFRHQINLWSDLGRVIIDVDARLDPANAALLVEVSDQVIWCVDSKDVDASAVRLKEIENRAPGWRDKINLVWLIDNAAWVIPRAPELSRLAKRDFVMSFSKPLADQGRHLLDGFERLIHQLRGIRIGLALGGGGARGMAHIGVLKALEDNGIVVDLIAGTSAGAMTGIVHAAGFSPNWATNQFATDLEPGWFFRMLPSGNNWYLLHKYRRSKFDRMLRKYLSDWNLEQLTIPVKSITVDLVTGEPVVRHRGDAVNCILESINLPVLSKPICRDGRVLVDGGIVNNIPADVLVKSGCNFVIAVSVTAHLKHEFARNRPDTPTSKMKPPSALKTMLRSYLVQSVNMNSVGVGPADVVIEPDVSGFEIGDFAKTRELSAIGEQTALKAIPKIKSLLAQMDGQLFPTNSSDDTN
jgi:NTE family protein